MLRLDAEQLDRVLAQLGWTLVRCRRVTAMQVLVDGTAVELSGGGTTVAVDGYGEFDAGDRLGLDRPFRGPWPARRRGRGLGRDHRPLGSRTRTPRRSPWASPDRSALRGRPCRRSPRRRVRPDRHERFAGDGVRRHRRAAAGVGPQRQLWLVDRRPPGAVAFVGKPAVRRTGWRCRRLGGTVESASLSRDGTRLVLAVRRGSATVLVLTRVLRRADGTPRGFTALQPLPAAARLRDVSGLGWRDPATVAVLTRPSTRTSGIELVSVRRFVAAGPPRTPGRRAVRQRHRHDRVAG